MAQMLYLPDGASAALFNVREDFQRLVRTRLGNDAAEIVENLFGRLDGNRSAGGKTLDLVEHVRQEQLQNRLSREKLLEIMDQIEYIISSQIEEE